MAEDSELKLSPKGAAGQVDVSFEHEKRGSTSPDDMHEGGTRNTPIMIPAAQPAKPAEHAR